jgi:hypothetical protein
MPDEAFTSVAEIVRMTLAIVQVVNTLKPEDHIRATESSARSSAVLPRLDFLHPPAPIGGNPLREAIHPADASTQP